jgi:hypothetical protein
MAITVTESVFDEYVHLTMTGSVDYKTGESIYASLILYIRKHAGSRFLFDVSDITGRPDIFQSIQLIDASSPEVIRQVLRIAVIDPVTSRAIYLVAESIMQTRGMKIKWFTQKDSALEWLTEKGGKS